MKRQKSCGPRLGKLVHQLFRVVTFAYDLCFRRMIAHWKDLSEDYNILHKISSSATYPKKRRLGPQNGSRSSGPEKLLKIVNCQNCQKVVLSHLEKVGGHRYPPGSIPYLATFWIAGSRAGGLKIEPLLFCILQIAPKVPRYTN
jgi:hypothetical protein